MVMSFYIGQIAIPVKPVMPGYGLLEKQSWVIDSVCEFDWVSELFEICNVDLSQARAIRIWSADVWFGLRHPVSEMPQVRTGGISAWPLIAGQIRAPR